MLHRKTQISGFPIALNAGGGRCFLLYQPVLW